MIQLQHSRHPKVQVPGQSMFLPFCQGLEYPVGLKHLHVDFFPQDTVSLEMNPPSESEAASTMPPPNSATHDDDGNRRAVQGTAPLDGVSPAADSRMSECCSHCKPSPEGRCAFPFSCGSVGPEMRGASILNSNRSNGQCSTMVIDVRME